MTESVAKVAAGHVERRENLSYAEFVASYMRPNKPVILTDALRQWPALTRWTPEFFRSEFRDMSIEIPGDRSAYGTSSAVNSGMRLSMPEFIDRVLSSSDENPAPYFRNQVLSEVFPSLRPDIEPVPAYFLPNWLLDRYAVKRFRHMLNGYAILELFIGGRGGRYPVVHYDHGGLHTFLSQIHGEKHYVIYPPEQTPYMYPLPEKPNLSAVNDVFEPDLARFPLFANATPVSCVLRAGELLFLPSCWWHTVRILSPSITLSINTINQSNWHALVNTKRSNLVAAVVSRVYLTGAGAWRGWRDRNWTEQTSAGARAGTWYV